MKILIANLPWEIGKNEYGVRAGSRWPHTRNKRRDMYYFPFPVYLAYAAAVLEKEGLEVNARDYLTLGLTEKELLKDIEGYDLLIAETSTLTFSNDIKICKLIKKKTNCKIALCGAHATIFPEEILENYDCVNYILIGEYDETAKELCGKLKKKQSLKKVLGLACREKGKVIVNQRRPLIKNLDSLPFPARHFFPMDRYNDAFCRNYPNMTMISSRGCPYRCIFCLEPNVIFGQSGYRFRSAKNVVDEMQETIKKYKPKEIYFDDASFMIGRQRVLDICNEIKKRKLNIKWSCMGDAINQSEDIIRKMAEAGCVAIKFGVESADKEILRNINKYVDLEKTRQFVKWCKKYKIRTHATYMFGLPGETKETIKKTIEYALRLNTDTAQFAIATPYPGTPFYKWALEKGYLKTADWEMYDGNVTPVIQYPNITNEELQEALKYAQNKYWMKVAMNPKEVATFFKNIYKMGGFTGLVSAIYNKIGWFLFDVLALNKNKECEKCG